MKSNVATIMEAPFHVNPLTWLRWTLEVSYLSHSFQKKFKLAKIVIVQMLKLMEDEQTFSILSFMKSKLKNHHRTHAHYCRDEWKHTKGEPLLFKKGDTSIIVHNKLKYWWHPLVILNTILNSVFIFSQNSFWSNG
jgi:hypothetical protein